MNKRLVVVIVGLFCMCANSFAQITAHAESFSVETGEWNVTPEEQAVLNARLQELLAIAQGLYTAEEVTAAKAKQQDIISTMGLITSENQFSSPYTESKEGSFEYLLDGDASTFWHSNWSDGSVDAGTHYFVVKLNEAYKGVLQMTMTRRTGVSDDFVKQFVVYGSNDDSEYAEIATLDIDESSPVAIQFELPTEYEYLKFVCTDTYMSTGTTRGYFHMGEFQLYEVTKAGITDKETALLALDEAVTKAQTIVNATEGDVNALEAAINAYKAFLIEKGDFNHDGIVDITDVVAVIDNLLGNANPNFDATLADVDDDGIVDIDDVMALVDKCLGREEDPIEVEEFDIVNPVAKDYMKNSYSTFTTSSYLDNSSFKTLRAAAFKNYRCDQPNTKTITFKTDSPTARVVMATDKKYKNVVLNKEVTVVNGEGSYMLRNFVPGRAYYYKVVDGEKVLTSGALKATGQLRMIRIDDSWNIRDIGGWTGWEGNTVRYEEIYRGGSLGGICDKTKDVISQESGEELKRIGLKAHLDLRSMYADVSKVDWKGSTPGAFSLGDSPIPNADFLLMVCSWALNNPTKNSSVIGGLAYVIKSVLDGKPVYFHCRTGADRTGTVGFLIEGLLGMYPYKAGNNAAEMAMEYELTGLSMDEDGTIAYNNGTMTTPTYSNRQASGASAYGFFNTLLNSSAIPSTYSMQDRCYYYVNRYFKENSVSTAGEVYINKSDLDRFINYMLGITDREGNVIDGKTKYVGPEWASDYEGNTLQNAIDIAVNNEFNH